MRILGGGLLAAIVLGGCFTGQRPSFDETVSAATATGEPSIDAVLERLDAVQGSLFTAEYEIVGANGDRSTATVVQAGGGRRAVTVDDVRYVITGDSGITCDLGSGECEASINDARISNLQLTHDFYAPAFATRLRVDADRRIQDPTPFTEQVDGQSATCVLVPVSGGEKTYCALDAGPLSRYIGPDVDIRLVGFSAEPDVTQIAAP
jgi:hypothetical protein